MQVNHGNLHLAADTVDGDGDIWRVAPIRSRPPNGVGVDGAAGTRHIVDADGGCGKTGVLAPFAVGVLFTYGADVEVVVGGVVEVKGASSECPR